MVLLLCFVSCQPTCHVFLMTADSRLGGEQYIFKIHFYNLFNCIFSSVLVAKESINKTLVLLVL